MKRYLFVTLIFMFIQSCLLLGQNIYHDAISLSKLGTNEVDDKLRFIKTNDGHKKAARILSKYIDPKDSSSYSEISEIFFDNPFFELPDETNLSGQKSNFLSKLTEKSIGGLNVTTFADGLAQFLVDRAKQELDVAFFNKFKTFLENNPEAGILFPTTTDYISNFSIHEYALFIASLREAFYNDLKNLIYNVDDVFFLPKYAELINENPEIIISINCIQLIIDLEEGTHPVEVIEKLKNLKAWTDYESAIEKKPALKNLHNGLKTSYILANSVRGVRIEELGIIGNDTIKITGTDTISIAGADILRIIGTDTLSFAGADILRITRNDTLRNEKTGDRSIIFNDTLQITRIETLRAPTANNLGAVKIDTLKISATDTLRIARSDFLNNSKANDLRISESYISSNWVAINEFRKNILQDPIAFQIFLGLIYQQAANEKIEFAFLKNKANKEDTTSVKFTKYLSDNKKNLVVFQSLFLEVIQKGTMVDQSIKEIREKEGARNLTREDYYKYINSSIDVIEFGFKLPSLLANDVTEDKYQNYITLARQGNNLYRNIYEKQYSAAILNASSILTLTFEEVYRENKEQKENTVKVSENILRYGTFMANVIEAEDPTQVKAAIDAAVLPVGSSTVKKYYSHNFSLNAYIGAQFRKPAETVQQSWDAAMGFTAPVGFAYTPFSMGRKGSISVFVPLIDVGAIAQFRLSDDTSQIEEDISLGNIFSPGGYLVYGMAWDLPISIGLGGQYGPGLVSFDASTPNVINPSWRWNVFLAVDIPLFNLSKGKRLKNER